LIEHHADVNARNSQNDTPLHLVCAIGANLPTIQLLVSNGANPILLNNLGLTSLHCIMLRETDIFTYAENKPAGGNAQPSLAAVKLLLDTGVPMNAVSAVAGNTALHLAARLHAGEEVIKLLVERGADMGLKNRDFGFTAYDEAVSKGFTVLAYLLRPQAAGPSRELVALLNSSEAKLQALRDRHNMFHAASVEHCDTLNTVLDLKSQLQRATQKMDDAQGKLSRVFLSDAEQSYVLSQIVELDEVVNSVRRKVFGIEEQKEPRKGTRAAEDPKTCSICLDASLNAVLNCGHPMCRPCAEQIAMTQGA
jgi:hypothetical protein